MIVNRDNVIPYLESVGERSAAAIIRNLLGEAACAQVLLGGYREQFGSLLDLQNENRAASQATSPCRAGHAATSLLA